MMRPLPENRVGRESSQALGKESRMSLSTILEIPEHEFDDEDWEEDAEEIGTDDEELDLDEYDEELDEGEL
jgi:hypothetical protein